MTIEKYIFIAILIAATINAFKNILKSVLIEMEIKNGTSAKDARNKFKKSGSVFGALKQAWINKKNASKSSIKESDNNAIH